MERVRTLIQKLQQQLDENVTTEQLLLTVQMLYGELTSLKETGQQISTSKIYVMMPTLPAAINQDKQKDEQAPKRPAEPEIKQEDKIIEVLQVDEKEIEEELEEIKRNAASKNNMSQKAKPALLFDPVEDVPTLTHQKAAADTPKDFNETAASLQESVNERLNENKKELVETLKEEPIKDLRKGIAVNDRFLFINELFRGDEAMYERSIKTINNFSILAEAEYWIRRELKVKIGWKDSDPFVKQFDHLVRRRFS